jgi:hypothetical protein
MSHKSTDVKTPGIVAIAKKWKLPVAKVMELVNQGAEVEKEHNKSIVKARQVARDHINERPDYYNKLKKMEKTPISVKEETGISGVRGLGYVTGDPGVDYIQNYIDTNAMAYEDDNGSHFELIKKKHLEHHNNKLGFNFFDPTDGNASNKTLKEAKHPLQVNFDKYRKGKLNELGGNVGYEGLTDASPKKINQLEEGPKLDKAKKIAKTVAVTGMTAANMYTMGDAISQHKPRHQTDMVRAATALPGAAGWGASAVHYGKKGYDLAKATLKKKAHMEEEKKMGNPCWKGYKAYGMKKKDGKEVPNCVPVEEQGSSATPYTERPTYESAAWQRKAGKNPEGGLNRKGIASYRRENPGSKLSMAVTTEPSKLDPDSKPAKRRKSFCARMGGMKGPMKDEKGRPTRKALSLRKWNCEEENKYPQTAERSIYEMDTDNMPTSKNIEDRRPSLLSSMLKSAHQSIQSGIKSGSITDLKSVETQASDAVKRSASDYFSRQNRNNDLLDKSTPKPKIDIDSYKGPSKPAEPLPGKPERMKIDEKAPPGAKYERMVKHIKAGYAKDGLTKKEKGIAFATAWKAKNKEQIDEISDTLVGRASNAAFWKGKAPSERLTRYIVRAQTRDPKKKEEPKKKQVKENMHGKDWDVATGKLPEQTYFHPTHKHTARLSKEKAMKPDNIIEPGGVKGHVSSDMHTEQTKETTMDNQNLINEALENILENNLNDMKENLLEAINEKAMEKLEERKKAIAADYFAQ